MGIINRSKPKSPRTAKSLKEKVDALADKKLLEWIKNDDEVLRVYINKREGLTIPPESERKLNRILEDTKLMIYRAAADDIQRDPEFMETVRDKFVSELLGQTYNLPRTRGKGSRQHVPNFNSQIEKLKQTIAYVDQLKDLIGTTSNSWTKVFQNPEVIKVVMELAKGLLGSFGLSTSTNTTAIDNRIIAVEINGKYVEMNQQEYEQYCMQRKGEQLPEINPETPPQDESKGETDTDGENPPGKTGAQK